MSDNLGDVVVEKQPAEEMKRKPDELPAAGDETVKHNEDSDNPKQLNKKDSARKSTSPKSKSPSTPRRTRSKDKKHSSDSESEGEELTEAEDLGASTGSTAGQSEVFNAGKASKSKFINNFRRILLFVRFFTVQNNLTSYFKQ